MQFIFEFICEVIFEILVQGFFGVVKRVIFWTGIGVLKCTAEWNTTMNEVKVIYQKSTWPYFLGVFIWATALCALFIF